MPEQTELGLASEATTTTAIYANRRRDKARVERTLGIRERGDENTEFFTRKGTLLAKGYNRVVYGDHGPYIEFERCHFQCPLLPRFPRPAHKPLPPHCHYEWLVPSDGSGTKIYDQKRDVKHLPNPPAGGYRGNRQAGEGYADYLPGKLYVSPSDTKTKP